ncbi:MAG: hypothetical protein ACRC30_02315 [Clostridium sp.]
MYNTFNELIGKDKLKEYYGEIATLNQEGLIFDAGIDKISKEQFYIYKNIYIYVEHVLYSAFLIYGDFFSIEKVLAMYTGMIETFTDALTEEQYRLYVKSLYYLKDFVKNEKELNSKIIFYLRQSNKDISDIKMFSWEDEKETKIVKKTLKFFKDREKIYKNLIVNVKSKHLAEDNITIKSIKIVDNKIKRRLEDKNKISTEIITEVNRELHLIDDAYIEGMGKGYSEQIKKIRLYNVENNKIIDTDEKFKLIGKYTHLAGKTGSGKTVYMDIVIKKLAENGRKILIITDKTSNSIACKEKLDGLGIESTIITGKERIGYIQEYYNSKITEEKTEGIFNNPFETMMRNKKIIENLDEFCLEEKWVTKEHLNENFEYRKNCSKCVDEDKFMKCGYYNLYRKMLETNVIIATAKTVLLSKIPIVFDSKRRTLFEFGILNSDLVLVDEIDEIQKEFDDAFLDEIKIYSGNSVDNSYSRGDIESLLKIVDNIDRSDIVEKENVKNFKNDVRSLDNIVDTMISLFLTKGNQDFIRSNVHVNENFNLVSLIEGVYVKYIKINAIEGKDKRIMDNFYNFFTNEKSIKKIKKKYFDEIYNLEFNIDEFDEVIGVDEKEIKDINTLCRKIFWDLKVDIEEYITKQLKETYVVELKVLRETKRASKKQREEERVKILIFIMLIALIDFYYKNIRSRLKTVIPYVGGTKDNGVKDLVFKYLYKEDIPLVPESLLESFISNYSLLGESENKKETLILKKNNYNGIGREVLFNTTKNLAALYNTKVTPMFLASATSIDTKGSMYTLKYPVNRLLENQNQKKERKSTEGLSVKERKKLKAEQENALTIKCHIFNDKDGRCYISGSEQQRLENNIKRLIRQFNFKLLPDLKADLKQYYEKNKMRKGILITTSSYRIAKKIFENIYSEEMKIRILYTKSTKEEFDINKHIEIGNVERIANEKIDILIAVNKSIGRGYNIMESTGQEAYFRHIIIANRYLPTQSDSLTNVSYLHDLLTRQYRKEKKITTKDFKELKSKVGKLQIKLKYQQTYNSKDTDIKNMIAGNMFAEFSQIKGRGQRGGANCIIHFIDSSFYPQTAEYYNSTKKNINQVIKKERIEINGEEKIFDDTESIFNKFIKILDKNNILVIKLFDDMIEAFENHMLIIHD